MDAVQNVRTVNLTARQLPLCAAHSKALLSMQPGDSFTIPNDESLRGNVLRAARYWGIPATSRAVSPQQIRIWRLEHKPDKPIDPRPIAVTREVPPPAPSVKLTSAAEIALLREAKAKSMRQKTGDRIQEIELVNNERHTVTLVIVEKKAGV